jgi:putative ABC transport system permease protein
MAIVVCLTTLVERGRAATIRSLERAGLCNLYLVARPETGGSPSAGGRLTREEAERLASLAGARAILAIRVERSTASGAGPPFPASVYAASGPLAPAFPLRARAGRLLASLDFALRSPYCVIGSEVARLAGLSAPIGGVVNVGRRSYEVVGTLEESRVETASSAEVPSIDWNRAIVVPLGTEPLAGDADARDPVDVAVIPFATAAEAGRAAELAPRANPSRFGPAGAVRVASPVQTLQHYRQARRTFDRIVWIIALLTAASAVVGISNLLSASVIARTKEIGLRRAVGARAADIVLQFEAEGLLLGLLGGGLGLAAGGLLSFALIDPAGSGAPLSFASFSALAVGCALAGIATGIRPSIRASRIDPAAALREG